VNRAGVGAAPAICGPGGNCDDVRGLLKAASMGVDNQEGSTPPLYSSDRKG